MEWVDGYESMNKLVFYYKNRYACNKIISLYFIDTILMLPKSTTASVIYTYNKLKIRKQ